MHYTSLTVADLRELDDLDNVNLSSSIIQPSRPGLVPGLNFSQVYSEDSPIDTSQVSSKEPAAKPHLPARYCSKLDFHVKNTQKFLQISQTKVSKIDRIVKDRIEKDRKLRNERSASSNKLTLKKVFNIENLVDTLKEENLTISQSDIFESKIKARIKESIKILKKSKDMKNPTSKSIIHATLCENVRLVEAQIDSASSDMDRAKKVNTTDQYLRTALHYSCALGNDIITSILLKMGADCRLLDYKGRSALHYASFSSCGKLVPLLIRSLSKFSKLVQSMSTIKNSHTVARVIKFKRLNTSNPNAYGKTLDLTHNCPATTIDLPDFNEVIDDLLTKMNRSSGKSSSGHTDCKFIDWTDNESRTALHYAVFNDKSQLVQALLDAGASISIEDSNHKRPLELSRSKFITSLLVYKLKESLNSHKSKISSQIDNRDLKALSEEDISKYVKSDSQFSYLMNAVRCNNLETVKILLNKKVNISDSNSQGWNSLMYAIQSDSMDMVKVMLEGSENESQPWKFGIRAWVEDAWKALDNVTIDGWTVVHIAAAHSSPDMVEYILKVLQMRMQVQSDPDCPEVFKKFKIVGPEKVIDLPCRKQFTAFLLAVRHNRLDVVKVLVKWDCDVYVRNGKLQNALHIATSRGHKEIIEYLVRKDADKNILRTQLDIQKRKPKDLDVFNKLEKSFFHAWDYCRLGDCEKLKELILSQNYSVNEQTPIKKLSLLHVAVEYKQVAVIKVLLELGAFPSILNSNGKTPLVCSFEALDGEFIKTVSSLFLKHNLTGQNEENFEDFNREKVKTGKFSSLPMINKKKDYQNVQPFEKREVLQYWEIIGKKIVEKKVTIVFLFDMMDQGRKGALSLNEFQGMIVWLGLTFSAEVCLRLFKATDENLDGLLEYAEIIKMIHRVTARPAQWTESKSMPRLQLNKSSFF